MLVPYDLEFQLGVVQEYLDDSSESLDEIETAINQLKAELGDLEVEYVKVYRY